MKSIVALTLLCFLAACTTPPFSKEMSPYPQAQMQEQELFIAALDQFSATHKLDLLDRFRQQYPDSSLVAYADTISLYAEELDTRKAQLKALEEEHQQVLAQLARLSQEQQQLHEQLSLEQQENLQLSEKIEQLKTLLIEQEQRRQ